MPPTLLADVAETSRRVADTARRLGKVELLAALLQRLSPDETTLAVDWLTGELPQRQIGVGWAALRTVPVPADTPTLTIAAVHTRFDELKSVTGSGSQARRRELLADLLGAATEPEQAFLRALLAGGLRQGALAGVMTDAIARATAVPIGDVRRAAMLTGNLARTAALAQSGGVDAVAAVQLEVGRPIGPMLAQTATNVDDALSKLGAPVLWQYKLDGARIQVHKSGSDVRLFTRSLDDITARMPDVTAAIAEWPVRDLVADGEVLSLRTDGRPQPFQKTASRVGTRGDSG